MGVYVELLINIYWGWHTAQWELLSAPGLAPVRTIPTTRLSLWRNSSFPRKSAIKSSWQQPVRWFLIQWYLGGLGNAINSTFHQFRKEISILFKTTWVEAGPGRLDLCLWLFYVAKLSFNTRQGWKAGLMDHSRQRLPNLFKTFTWWLGLEAGSGSVWPLNV